MPRASPSRAPLIRAFDRATLLGISAGLACMLQPWWEAGFRLGFFATLVFAVLQIVASHLPREDAP